MAFFVGWSGFKNMLQLLALITHLQGAVNPSTPMVISFIYVTGAREAAQSFLFPSSACAVAGREACGATSLLSRSVNVFPR